MDFGKGIEGIEIGKGGFLKLIRTCMYNVSYGTERNTTLQTDERNFTWWY